MNNELMNITQNMNKILSLKINMDNMVSTAKNLNEKAFSKYRNINQKKIYLVGCDASNNGYYYNNDLNYLDLTRVLLGWNKIKEFKDIYYPNTEIISINPVGLKGLFDKDVYTKDGVYVDENGNKLDIL